MVPPRHRPPCEPFIFRGQSYRRVWAAVTDAISHQKPIITVAARRRCGATFLLNQLRSFDGFNDLAVHWDATGWMNLPAAKHLWSVAARDRTGRENCGMGPGSLWPIANCTIIAIVPETATHSDVRLGPLCGDEPRQFVRSAGEYFGREMSIEPTPSGLPTGIANLAGLLGWVESDTLDRRGVDANTDVMGNTGRVAA